MAEDIQESVMIIVLTSICIINLQKCYIARNLWGLKQNAPPIDVTSSLENATLTDLYHCTGNYFVALSALHIAELAGMPTKYMELLSLQYSHIYKMADLNTKNKD